MCVVWVAPPLPLFVVLVRTKNEARGGVVIFWLRLVFSLSSFAGVPHPRGDKIIKPGALKRERGWNPLSSSPPPPPRRGKKFFPRGEKERLPTPGPKGSLPREWARKTLL